MLWLLHSLKKIKDPFEYGLFCWKLKTIKKKKKKKLLFIGRLLFIGLNALFIVPWTMQEVLN